MCKSVISVISSLAFHPFPRKARTYMRLQTTLVSGLCAIVCSTSIATAQDYGATMERKIKSVLGARELRHYEWISYPTNNFGVMTMFITDSKGKKIKVPEDQECATFTC